jgi:hypothetical protein
MLTSGKTFPVIQWEYKMLTNLTDIHIKINIKLYVVPSYEYIIQKTVILVLTAVRTSILAW